MFLPGYGALLKSGRVEFGIVWGMETMPPREPIQRGVPRSSMWPRVLVSPKREPIQHAACHLPALVSEMRQQYLLGGPRTAPDCFVRGAVRVLRETG